LDAEAGGDYRLAVALSQALARRGYRTTVGAGGIEPESEMADVVITLRGRMPVSAAPKQITLAWVISHPDEVRPEELERCDAVLVASRTYARKLAAELPVPVHPFLQFSDPAVFYPEVDPGRAHDLVFVGNMRSVLRRVVWDAWRAGYAPAIYGQDWRFVAPELTVAERAEPDLVRRIYSSSKVVLNDHWDDMRRQGFVNNRVYDVLACEGFLLTDHVPGMEDEFGDAVETYADRAELTSKLKHYLSDERERKARASRGRELILERHTADRRAAELEPILERLGAAR
jgi:hypothetical protein